MKKYFIFFSLIIIFVSSSCSDYNQFIPYEQPSDELAFLNGLVPKVNSIQIDSDIKNVVAFSDSIFLEIPANAFVDDVGRTIEETISIVFYAHSKGVEFVADDISMTLISNHLIGVSSLFFIGAYDAQGNALELADQKTITVKFPVNEVNKDLLLYFPVEGANKIQDLQDWNKAESTTFVNHVYKEGWTWQNQSGEINHSNGYIVKANQLKWMGLGYDIITESGVNLEIELPVEFTAHNTHVFVKGKSIPSFEKLEWNSDRQRFCHLKSMIPLGSEIKILILSKKEDRIYIDLQDYVLHFDTELFSTPVKQDVVQILEIIKDF